MRQFFQELKRRNVYRVAATYAVVGFVVIQAADLILPALQIPSWAYRLVVVLTLLGLPVALVLAWAFEMTPEGVRRTPSPALDRDGGDAASGEAGAQSEGADEAGSRRRLPVKAFVVLGVLAAALLGGWYLTGGGASGPETDERTVAVLPFEVSGAGADTWRDGMVTMLSMGLDGAGQLRAISDRTVFAAWERREPARGQGGVSSEDALSVAREVGARYGVIGSAVALGGELQLAADVHETRSGERLGRVRVRGSTGSVTALTDTLARGLLGLLLEQGSQGVPGAGLASQLTQSQPALLAYLEGERHYRRGAFDAAMEAYRRAVDRDTAFALGYWRLSWASGWVQAGTGATDLERAYRLADRLPRREQRLLRAGWLWRVRGLEVPARDSLRRLSAAYPDDPRVWYELGEVILHHNLPGGWPEAERAFERAVELDPGHGPYHIHPLMIAFTLHRDSALVAERWARSPRSEFLEPWIPLGMELVFGPRDRREAALARIDSLEDAGQTSFIGLLGPGLWHPRDGEVAEAYRRTLDVPATSPFLTQTLLRRGRIQAALPLLGEAPIPVTVACGLAEAASLGLPVPDSILRVHLDPAHPESDPSLTRRLCTGVYLLERGRTTEAEELMEGLRSDEAGREEGLTDREGERREVLDVLRGYRAWRQDDLERAARLLTRSVHASSPIPSLSWRGLWRGDVLRELGRLEEAEGWYVASWWHPLAHQRLGRLYEQMDRPEEAAAAYDRFIEAWESADESLQGRVEASRERLSQLAGETDRD